MAMRMMHLYEYRPIAYLMQLTNTLILATTSSDDLRSEGGVLCPPSLSKSSFARSNSSVGTQKCF